MILENEIAKIEGIEFLPEHDLTSLTTIKLSSKGDLVKVFSVKALEKLLPLLHKHKRQYLVIGWGANQVLPPFASQLLIHLQLPFEKSYLDEARDEYELPASLGLNHLTAHAVKFGLKGWEVFTGIPASLGGAIFMNAGTSLGEIASIVKEVSIMTNDGFIRREKIDRNSFSYRENNFVNSGEVIIGAKIIHQGVDPEISKKIKDYLRYRKETQPLTTRNCGCVFKNPSRDISAGKLIELLGLKGLTLGNLKVSFKHANFVEHSGGSSLDEFNELIDIIKFNTDMFYGIEFELEAKIPYD